MARYKTKHCGLEAIQWTGKNIIELLDWGQGKILWDDMDNLYVETSEGTLRANIKDFIIKSSEGEFYPCKPDILKKEI